MRRESSTFYRSTRCSATLVMAFVALLVLLQPLRAASAQTRSSQQIDSLRTLAASALERADTLLAELALESLVRVSSSDASAWHALGTLRWQRTASARRGGYMRDVNSIRALRGADTALRLATQLARDSARFWLSLAHFGLESGVASVRFAAAGQMELAYESAKRAGDSARLAESASEIGLASWRRYELIVNRALSSNGGHVQLQTETNWRRTLAKDYLETFAKKIQPPTGAAEYARAFALFTTAMDAAPHSVHYARNVVMALATRRDWTQLLAVATRRAAQSAFDGQAQLARGLALHRLGRDREALTSFDSASALMDDSDRDALFRIDRLLPPAANALTGKRGFDSSAMATSDPTQKQVMSALYWKMNDPNSSTAFNEAELEFKSRVAEADFRWTNDLTGQRGADSDRGDILVRFGPPDDEMTISGTASVQQLVWDTLFVSRATIMESTSQVGGTSLAWLYKSGDVFFFDLAPGFGTARTPLSDQQYVRDYETVRPVTWENVALPLRVASAAIRVTRFRANGDSTDFAIVTQTPARILVADSSTKLGPGGLGGNIRTDLRIFDARARLISHDTSHSTVTSQLVSTVLTQNAVKRVAPGAAFVRFVAEHASAHGEATRAANALIALNAEQSTGFGMSDVLVSAAVSDLHVDGARRWTDVGALPSTGTYGTGEKVGLVWETYALRDSIGTNHYRISITVERVRSVRAAGLAIRVLDGVGALLRIGKSTTERVVLTFDRVVPARDIHVDAFSIDGLTDSNGDYLLRIEVADVAGNQRVSRELRLAVR